MEKSLRDFVSEAEELLEGMGQDFGEMEEGGGEPDPDLLNRLFRGAHSLKGLAGMFGFPRLSHLAHRVEDLMDALRLGKVQMTPSCRDLLSEGIRLLREAVAGVAEGKGDVEEGVLEPYHGKVERFLKVEGHGQGDDLLSASGFPKELANVLTEYEEHRFKENLRKGNKVYRISMAFPLEVFEESLTKATRIIKERGELITTLPDPESVDPAKLSFDLLVGSSDSGDTLLQALEEFQPRLREVYERKPVQPIPEGSHSIPRPSRIPESLRSLSQTVRVEIEQLDIMLNLVGELLMAKSAMQKLLDSLAKSGFPVATHLELEKRLKLMERKLEELRNRVMDVRMVPLRQVFDKLQRVVTKLSKDLGKKVEVEIYGSETELDKVIVEELVDPLMHLVRNALDHGIESPEERKRMKKPEVGKIVLSAYQKGNHVVIEVKDDGRGIDLKAIEAKAIERGLIPPDHTLHPHELRHLIFSPGFSTKNQVSEVSGRGVGLDVVKSNIVKLKGMIEVKSEVGEGTTFVLTLPMTLAIIQALVIQTGRYRFAIPLNSVLESIQLDRSQIQYLEGRPVMDHRGTWIFLTRLEEIFQLPRTEDESDQLFVVLVGVGERRMGILVDKLVGEESIVLKPLRSILQRIPGIGGACEQGDQAPLLVLDVSSLIEESLRSQLYGP